MQRTNIFLTEEQQRQLVRRAREEGLTKSSLVRQILDEALDITRPPVSAEEKIRATAGLWADRDATELREVLEWRRQPALGRRSR